MTIGFQRNLVRILCFVFCFFSFRLFAKIPAQMYIIDNMYYWYSGSGTEVSVCAYSGESATVNIPDSVLITAYNEEKLRCRVTSIGKRAFENNDKISSVTIPGSVTSIGNNAFANCSGLTSVTMSHGVEVIGWNAFFECTGLTSITIPSSVTSIGIGAFYGCSGLKSVTMFEGLTSIEMNAFHMCGKLSSVSIPSTVKTIGSNAFSECRELAEVTLSKGLASIESEAFAHSGLTSVTIPDGVTSIANRTFEGCGELASVAIPEGVTRIGYRAFAGCGLTSVTIPRSVTGIEAEAFSGCSKLTSLTTPCDLGVGNSGLPHKTITTVIIQEGETRIADSFFRGWSALTSVTIPSSVTSIGDLAFGDCRGLTSVTIPDSVTSIGRSAFSGCSELTEVAISEGVTSIGNYAFFDCSALASVTIPSNVTSIGSSAFSSDVADLIFEGAPGSESVSWYSRDMIRFSPGQFVHIPLLYMKEWNEWKKKYGTTLNVTSYGYCPSDATDVKEMKFETIGDRTWSYSMRGDSARIEGVCPATGDISIPARLGDCDVRYIGEYAFDCCRELTNVTIPNGVISIGDWAFHNCTGLRSVTIPDSITSIEDGMFWGCRELADITIPNGVRNIGNYAFWGCCGLTSIDIPNGVDIIGSWAFWGCSGLKSVTIPDSVRYTGWYVFRLCKGLTNVSIPDGIKEIGAGMFFGCSDLTSVTIPSSVTSIGEYAFCGCSGLTSVPICEGVTSIGEYAFSGCSGLTSVATPLSWKIIGEYAFHDCSGLTSVTISSNVTSIGKNAFSGCSGLTSVTIPACVRSLSTTFPSAYYSEIAEVVILDGVTRIESREFYECHGLMSVTIPSSVTRIGDLAFEDCSGLTSVTIPEGVTSIGNYAFEDCSGLTSVTIPSSVTSIGKGAFSGCSRLQEIKVDSGNTAYCSQDGILYDYDKSILIRWPSGKLGTVTIPSSVTNIESYAFSGCSGLTEVTIPSSVTSIGDYAFSGCSGLTEVTIPSSVTIIGDYAFTWCTGLTEVTIPSSVTNIGDSAFYACGGLTSVAIPACVSSLSTTFPSAYYSKIAEVVILDGVTRIESREFYGCRGLTSVTIPLGVTNIGERAFYNCSGLTSVTIPSSVTSIGDFAFAGCSVLNEIVFRGEVPDGIGASRVFDYATRVYYPRKYASQYEQVVPPEIFAGYTDEDIEELVIKDAQLPPAMEMEEYEVQLECSGGAEPYSWWMSEDGCRTDVETSSFAEVGEAQGWREDGGWWEYELPFPFLCCGRTFKTVFVDDNANLEFEDDLGRYASIYSGFGDLYSEGVGQDIFVEREQDCVTFRWKRVKYSERDNVVNYAVALYSNGVIRCSFGDCTDEVRSVEVFGDLVYGAYVEQEGDDDIVFTPNYLPIGLWLSEDGIISGVPEQAGHYDFEVTVQDDNGEVCSKTLSVDVAVNPNRRPVVASCEPSWNDVVRLRAGERASFAVSATDPDGDGLSYRWSLDGVEIAGANGASYELTTDMSMRGRHWLTCAVSDGIWSIEPSSWSISIGGELFVSAEDGADALQRAVDQAIDGDVIYVGPGTYSSVEVPWLQSVRIVATDGCANTIIDGRHAASCFRAAYGGTDTNNMVRVEGFTLQDGCAEQGGGAMNAWLIGCILLGNVADNHGGGLCYGRADSCLIVGNSARYGGGAYQTPLYNCTVYFNAAYEGYGGGVNNCNVVNTIVWGNYLDSEPEMFATVDDDPLFVDAANLNFRLAEGSPCIGMGDNSQVATVYDLDGNVRIQGGSVDLGAYESAYSLPYPDEVAWLSVSPRTYAILLDWADTTYAKWYKVYRVDDALDDGAAELIATTADVWYVDETAVHGTNYRYWVVPCNEVGEGERSAPDAGGLLPPLDIVDSQLPEAISGSNYVFEVHATGGDGNYVWSLTPYKMAVEEQSSFVKEGDPQGWFDDDADWLYELPFDFPLGDSTTSVVTVNDNGFLVIPFENEAVTVYAAWGLDLYANPGDIYVSETDDAITFRWERVVYDNPEEQIDVAATLYANGSIRLSCAGGVTSVDRGFECQESSCYSYGASGDVVLIPNALPSGLELSEDGIISGVPEQAGHYDFEVTVQDDNGEVCSKTLSVDVVANPEQCPFEVIARPYFDGIYLFWPMVMNAETCEVYRVEDGLDDEMAEKIGEVGLSEWEFVEFRDYGALPGVTYRYWVVARNAAGESQKSNSVTARLLEPLEITASEVPAGVSEMPYEYALEAQGGGGEYLWYVPALRGETRSENTYAKVGNTIDKSQSYYPLPFDFVVGDQVINEVEIGDFDIWLYWRENDSRNGIGFVYAGPNSGIDVPWNMEKVCVAESGESITFCFEGVIGDGVAHINTSITLCSDGRIVIACDDESAPFVERRYQGWFSYFFEGDEWIGLTGDVLLCPNVLPAGLELFDDGVLTGAPQEKGEYSFSVCLYDQGADHWIAKTLSMQVFDGLSETIDGFSYRYHLTEGGAVVDLVEVADPEQGESSDSLVVPAELGGSVVCAIGECAFVNVSLKSVEIPASVKSIGTCAFDGCELLASVTLHEGLESIGEFAFYCCFSLESVYIPSSVSNIGESAFEGCDMLTVVYVDKGGVERVKGLCDWPSGVEFVEISLPSVEGDPGATVTGDAETGYVIKPSEGKTVVEVTIPQGVDAAKVTIEVSPKVASVKPNGAKVKIVSGGSDITEYLNIPGTVRGDDGGVVATHPDDVIDLSKATVKEEIVKEAMDPAKGAKIELNAANPKLTTPNTRIGLFYQLREGTTLGGMANGDSTVGNGQPWTPAIKVKGGNSAFYSIGVGKGE